MIDSPVKNSYGEQMKLTKEIELGLSIISLVIVAIRVRYGFKAYSARKNIFSGDKHFFLIGLVANLGYAVVGLMLGIYFLLLYLEVNVTTLFFVAILLLLLIVLIIEATFRRKG